MAWLYHLAPWPWSGPDSLRPPSLQAEGFVHLCSQRQLLQTARRWFAKQPQLALMVLDQERLGPDLRWEDLYGHGQAYPHLYAEIPESALVGILRMERDSEGDWKLPSGIPLPLLEGPDPGPALIEPRQRFPQPLLPPTVVLCYFPWLVERLEVLGLAERLEGRGSALGPDPIWLISHAGRSLACCFPTAGSPLAAVTLEELIALGGQTFVLCGGAGSLADQPLGQLVLVESALRDEGTSFHYLDPGEEVEVAPEVLDQAAAWLKSRGIAHQRGKTWTTDALYRETPQRLARRKAQGCLTVEMEVAAALAVAHFRGVDLVPLLHCGDALQAEGWDFRQWTSAEDLHQKLFWLAVELACVLRKDG